MRLTVPESAVFWMLTLAGLGCGLIIAATAILAGLGWSLCVSGLASLGAAGALFHGIRSNG